jgi:hypothetical protein
MLHVRAHGVDDGTDMAQVLKDKIAGLSITTASWQMIVTGSGTLTEHQLPI